MDIIPEPIYRWWYRMRTKVSVYFWVRTLKNHAIKYDGLFELLATNEAVKKDATKARNMIANFRNKLKDITQEDVLCPLFLKKAKAIEREFRSICKVYREILAKNFRDIDESLETADDNNRN